MVIQIFKFDNNSLEIAGKKYNATEELMELLTKKDPDLVLWVDEDYEMSFFMTYSKQVHHMFFVSSVSNLNLNLVNSVLEVRNGQFQSLR